MQILPSNGTSDPRILLGFGYIGVWTEFSADGEVLYDNRFSAMSSWGKGDVQSYRVLKAPWKGEPNWPPAVAFGEGKQRNSVFVSWRGATEIKKWKVQQANESACLEDLWEDVFTTPKTGFGTQLDTEGCDMRFLRVVALHAGNEILGVSETLDLGWEVGANGVFDALQIRTNSPVQSTMIVVAALALFVIVYESFRQFHSWAKIRWLGYEQVHFSSLPV
jgi:hypothetical protein